MQPNRGSFLPSDSNRGNRRDGEIVNDTAGDCLRKLAAAVDTGATSEAREFFTMGPEDPRLSESAGGAGVSARGAVHPLRADRQVQLPPGEPQRHRGPGRARHRADAHHGGRAPVLPLHARADRPVPGGRRRERRGQHRPRLFQYTAAQMAEEFGLEKLSLGAQSSIRNLNTQVPYQVLHIIEPRTQRQYGKIDAKNKPWSSTWLEIGIGAPTATTPGPSRPTRSRPPASARVRLRRAAVLLPALEPDRPGRLRQGQPRLDDLGDTKALQAMEIGSATAIARIYDPPLNVPEDLKNASLVPGAINPQPNDSRSKVEPTVMIPPEAVTVGQSERDRIERRINRGCYGDVLFLLSNDERTQPRTAEEIRGKKEERLLQLGGMFSRFADEHLRRRSGACSPSRSAAACLPLRRPSSCKTAASASTSRTRWWSRRRAIGYTAMKEILSLGIAVAQARAAGADKIDGDEVMDTGAEMLGVKPSILKSDEKLAQERQQAAKAAQAKAMGEAMTQAAPAIKDLSNSDPEQLRQLAGMFGPAAAAQATGNGA
jgi:hypothetical protein